MAGFADLSPSFASFTLGDKSLPIPGLTFGHIRDLTARFPALGDLLKGKTVAASAIMDSVPDAVPAIIATGFGFHNDKEQEALAAKYNVGIQVDMIDAIVKATEPSGDGVLSKKLKGLLDEMTPAVQPIPSTTTSDSPSGS